MSNTVPRASPRVLNSPRSGLAASRRRCLSEKKDIRVIADKSILKHTVLRLLANANGKGKCGGRGRNGQYWKVVVRTKPELFSSTDAIKSASAVSMSVSCLERTGVTLSLFRRAHFVYSTRVWDPVPLNGLFRFSFSSSTASDFECRRMGSDYSSGFSHLSACPHS